jgi:hypothetical protein
MQENVHHIRILAIDVRLRKFGFVVLEGPQHLLEWGVKNYRSAGNDDAAVAQKRVVSLLTLLSPSVVVMKHTLDRNKNRRLRNEPIVEAIEEAAGRQSAEVALIRRREVQSVFGQPGITKYEIAARIATLFPELAWKLPPMRKFYENEHYNTSIFDAASLGLTYFARFGDIFADERRKARSPS